MTFSPASVNWTGLFLSALTFRSYEPGDYIRNQAVAKVA